MLNSTNLCYSCTMNPAKNLFWSHCFFVCVLAFNLRAPITELGPLLDSVQQFYGISPSLAGLLTTLPLLAFGSVSFIAAAFPPMRMTLFAISLLILGEILRLSGEQFGLFIGMAFLGCGIAIANVLLPSLVKNFFPQHTMQMMSVYSLVLNVSSIAGIAVALPLLNGIGLRGAFAFWLLFAFLALFATLPHIKRPLGIQNQNISFKDVIKHKTTWKLSVFMGLQSSLAYSVFSWYALIVSDKGFGVEYGAKILLISQIVAIPSSLFGPLFLHKLPVVLRLPYIACLCGMYSLGFIMLMFDEHWAMWASAILVGCPMGAVFGIVLLLIPLKANDFSIANKLSSMVQGCGYLLAACSPVLIGVGHEFFGNFGVMTWYLVGLGIAVCIAGLIAYKADVIDI